MENLHCDIVTDLLPLYVDGVASEESKRAVEAHLEGCAKCREQLTLLQKTVPARVDVDTAPMKKVKREIQKKRYTGIAIGVLVALTVVVLAYFWLTAPILLSPDEVAINIGEDGNGALRLSMISPMIVDFEVTEGPEGVYFTTCWTNQLARFQALGVMYRFPRSDCGYTFDLDKVKQVYYFTDGGGEDILLYSNGEIDGGVQTLPRLALNYYLLTACGGMVLCGALWIVLRKKKAGRGFGYAALFFVSYVLSHFAVMWGRGYSYFQIRDLSGILLVTLPLWGVLVLVCKAIDRGRKRRREMEGKR